MNRNVLCTSLGSEAGPHFDLLAAAGLEPRVVDRALNLKDNDALAAALRGCAAVIAGSEPYPRRVIEALPELRVIARTGVGFDAVDVAACNDHGVVVATTPGVNHDAVAEHTIALLMGVARDFPRQDRAVRRGQWVRQPLPRVAGSTLGLVGLGRIGRAVAWRAVGLGLRVVATEPHADRGFCERYGVHILPLEELLSASDYVSLHCPATAENHHLMNASRLAMMKPGSVLINTARGTLVNEADLAAALERGHLRAAGLDVYEAEPLPTDSPLAGMEKRAARRPRRRPRPRVAPRHLRHVGRHDHHLLARRTPPRRPRANDLHPRPETLARMTAGRATFVDLGKRISLASRGR